MTDNTLVSFSTPAMTKKTYEVYKNPKATGKRWLRKPLDIPAQPTINPGIKRTLSPEAHARPSKRLRQGQSTKDDGQKSETSKAALLSELGHGKDEQVCLFAALSQLVK
jgi:hypothetical protein